MGRMGLEAVRHVIVEMARLEEYQPTAASEQEFQNLNLTTKVQAALSYVDKPRSGTARKVV